MTGTNSEPGSALQASENGRKAAAVVGIILAVADQISKHAIVSALPLQAQRIVIPGLLNLVHFRNTGAAWGMFQGQSIPLAVISIIVLALLFWKFATFAEGYPERKLALGIMVGGIIGNLVDRMFRGEVVDFILFYYRSFHWPAFNIADMAISCGVIIYIASTFLRLRADKSSH